MNGKTLAGNPSVEQEAASVGKALEEVLAGSSFRSSPQCQALLRYIVEQSVAHRDEMLRERMIGINVFGRPADYDTGNDPVVRSRAAEVRKRLAQHYLQHEHGPEAMRIEIPSGSYRAIFTVLDRTWDSAPRTIKGGANLDPPDQKTDRNPNHGVNEHSVSAQAPVAQDRRRPASRRYPGIGLSWLRWLAGSVLVATILLTAGLFTVRQGRAPHQRLYDMFWAPIVNKQSVLIVIGANHTYILSDDFLDRYRTEHQLQYLGRGREFFIDLKSGDKIDENDLIPTNSFIGFGDVAAAARVASTLTRFNKPYDLRYGDNIAVGDLQSSPAVLIGGFSNVWTLEVMHHLPFRLEGGDRIVEGSEKKRVWIRQSDPGTMRGDDYAVVTRLNDSETGNFVLAIAGIDTYSNQASADFLDNATKLGNLLQSLPIAWQQKNMQIVLHTTVMAHVPAVVSVEAVKVW